MNRIKKNFSLGDYFPQSNKALFILHMEESPLKELSEYNKTLAVQSISEFIDYFKKINGIIVKIGTSKSGGMDKSLQNKIQDYSPVIEFTESSVSTGNMKAMSDSGLEMLLFNMKPSNYLHMDIILSGIYFGNIMQMAKDMTKEKTGADPKYAFNVMTADDLIGMDSTNIKEYPTFAQRRYAFDMHTQKKAEYAQYWRIMGKK